MKPWLTSLIITVILVMVVLYFIGVAKADEAQGLFDNKPCDDKFPLKLGSCGKRVQQLQVWLSTQGAVFPSGIDGVFNNYVHDELRGRNYPVEISEAFFNSKAIFMHTPII